MVLKIAPMEVNISQISKLFIFQLLCYCVQYSKFKKVELREAAALFATKAKINSSNCFKTIFPFFFEKCTCFSNSHKHQLLPTYTKLWNFYNKLQYIKIVFNYSSFIIYFILDIMSYIMMKYNLLTVFSSLIWGGYYQ